MPQVAAGVGREKGRNQIDAAAPSVGAAAAVRSGARWHERGVWGEETELEVGLPDGEMRGGSQRRGGAQVGQRVAGARG
jgi:hypothetical protein